MSEVEAVVFSVECWQEAQKTFSTPSSVVSKQHTHCVYAPPSRSLWKFCVRRLLNSKRHAAVLVDNRKKIIHFSKAERESQWSVGGASNNDVNVWLVGVFQFGVVVKCNSIISRAPVQVQVKGATVLSRVVGETIRIGALEGVYVCGVSGSEFLGVEDQQFVLDIGDTSDIMIT